MKSFIHFLYGSARASKSAFFPGRALSFLLILLLAPVALRAQALSGITGTITDESGATVANAKVIATNLGTNVKSLATTSTAGTYTITDLNPGTYSVLIEAPGFQSSQLNNIVVDPGGRRSTADAVLRTGAVSERVEIVAQSITLETSQPDIGATVEHKVVEELPMLIGGRNGGVAAGAVGR
jgi:Carboxypeptidase regulatory-like domain